MFFCLFRFKAVAAKSKLDLVNEGFTEFTIEDFHNTVSFLHKKKIRYLLLTMVEVATFLCKVAFKDAFIYGLFWL